MPLLFVYGSLKRGFRQHDRHLKTARFVAATTTAEAAFTLAAVMDPDTGDQPYPGARRGGLHKIAGEVFEIDEATLGRLDAYEGGNYERTELKLDSGQTAQAYFYTGNDYTLDPAHNRIRIENDTAIWLLE